jgi:xyloglucan:xyloglucosyl transferase
MCRFFVDQVPVRVHRHTETTNDVFPKEQGMYMFSSIWNADNWATRGGLEKTNWAAAPFVSSYKKFHGLGCKWEDDNTTYVLTIIMQVQATGGMRPWPAL